MMRTLNVSNQNIKEITEEIKTIASRLNKPNTLWSILMDTTVAQNLTKAIAHINKTGERAEFIAGDLKGIITDLKSGKGTVGALLTDTTLYKRLNKTLANVQSITDTFSIISSNLKTASVKLKNGTGAVGTLLTDTTFANNLNLSMLNIKNSAGNFNENMEPLHYSWPFKKYFRKQKKTAPKK